MSMNSSGKLHRSTRRAALLVLVALLAGFGCGGSGGGGGVTPLPMPNPIAASFAESGTAASPDQVRLRGTAVGTDVVVDVVIAGATTSSDLYSFAFDLVLSDASVATYVAGSATFGSALTLGAGQTGEALASQGGSRITVGVSKVGGGAGNGVGATEEVVASLRFRVLKREMTTLTIEGSPPNPPAALDSTGAVIASVVFDAAAAAIGGS